MRRWRNENTMARKWIVIMMVILLVVSGLHSSVAYARSNKADKTPPSTPLNLLALSVTDTSLKLSWTASSDNKAVTLYEIYQNGTLKGTSATTSYSITNLLPSTTYSFYVIAKDAAGNRSSKSNQITVTTMTTTGVTPSPTVTPTPTPTVTPTSIPTITPIPTATPTLTPSPTATPTPTVIPSPTATPTPTLVPKPAQKVIGYYAAWAAYSGFTPDKIDVGNLTHINYAFANIGSDYRITLGYPDVDAANLVKLAALKQTNPDLKLLIAVGGWSWSARFSDAALTDASRTVFADSCVDFIVKYGLDGVDIDWEYPVSGGLSTNIRRPEDKYNFTLLMQKLRDKLNARSAIDGKDYLLSFAGAAGDWYLNNVELSKLEQLVDYANLMTYDFHGSWDSYTDFNAPLYTNSDTSPQYKDSVDQSVKAWLGAGFPAKKIIMGVPFYGYVYKAVTNTNKGLYQTYSGASSISYANIEANYLNATGYTRYFHSESKVPWLFNGSTFICYEDEESIGYKSSYIKMKGLGGAMIWELSQDPQAVLLKALAQGLQN